MIVRVVFSDSLGLVLLGLFLLTVRTLSQRDSADRNRPFRQDDFGRQSQLVQQRRALRELEEAARQYCDDRDASPTAKQPPFSSTAYRVRPHGVDAGALLNKLFAGRRSNRGYFHHYYGDFYDLLFETDYHHRCDARLVLEVGLGSLNTSIPSNMLHWTKHEPSYEPGLSLRVWAAFFPRAFVVGLDIDEEVVQAVNEGLNRGGVETRDITKRIVAFQANSLDRRRIERLFSNSPSSIFFGHPKTVQFFGDAPPSSFDAILDDGLHQIPAIQATLCNLYPFLSPTRGLYMIEDVPEKTASLLHETLQYFFFAEKQQMLLTRASSITANDYVLAVVNRGRTRTTLTGGASTAAAPASLRLAEHLQHAARENNFPALQPEVTVWQKIADGISTRRIIHPPEWANWFRTALDFWSQHGVDYGEVLERRPWFGGEDGELQVQNDDSQRRGGGALGAIAHPPKLPGGWGNRTESFQSKIFEIMRIRVR